MGVSPGAAIVSAPIAVITGGNALFEARHSHVCYVGRLFVEASCRAARRRA